MVKLTIDDVVQGLLTAGIPARRECPVRKYVKFRKRWLPSA